MKSLFIKIDNREADNMARILRSMLSGAIFGSALVAAGVYAPMIIIGQMQFQDFHMLKTFLAASASSAIAIILANKYHFSASLPRRPASLNLFSSYDGNIIGGLLLGFGMTLTGACPGTLIPQLTTGVSSGPMVLLGGLLGGVIYSKLRKVLIPKNHIKSDVDKSTVFAYLDVKQANAMVVYEALCLGTVGLMARYFPDQGDVLVPAVVGGLFIGLSQAASLVLTGGTLGISAAYEQIGDMFWWAERTVVEGRKTPRPSVSSVWFALGSIAGSWVLFNSFDLPTPLSSVPISNLRAIFGGVLLTLGSRIAGGCTSGHGISGMSQLSMASFVTVASMFGGGAGLAALL